MRVHDEMHSGALGEAALAARKALTERFRHEYGMHPDERLDYIGQEIFRLSIMFGADPELAADLGTRGTLRERQAVLDDLTSRARLRHHRLDGTAPLEHKEPIPPSEHLAYWQAHLDKPSFVYFIQAGDNGPVKIGRAKDPVRRLAQIQTGSHDELHLRAIVPGASREERKMHHRFAEARIRGEWFGRIYLPLILTYADGMAMAAHLSHDGSSRPPAIDYNAQGFISDRENRIIRVEIEQLWQAGHDDAEIRHLTGLESAEYDDHVAAMRASTLYELPTHRNGRFFPHTPLIPAYESEAA